MKPVFRLRTDSFQHHLHRHPYILPQDIINKKRVFRLRMEILSSRLPNWWRHRLYPSWKLTSLYWLIEGVQPCKYLSTSDGTRNEYLVTGTAAAAPNCPNFSPAEQNLYWGDTACWERTDTLTGLPTGLLKQQQLWINFRKTTNCSNSTGR
jgi:hypothetical protein